MKLDPRLLTAYPDHLHRGLAAVEEGLGIPLYVTGGAVRDWLLGRLTHDIDITVDADPMACARIYAATADATPVLLDAEHGIVRAAGDPVVDFCRLRAADLAADLQARDFTINALAVPVRAGIFGTELVDPTGGVRDVEEGIIRMTGVTALREDPLRILRAFRFAATLGMTIEPATAAAIREHAGLLARPAGERIAAEFDILLTGRAAAAVQSMFELGVLAVVLPEVAAGDGCRQPASHHLDVLGHSIEALARMEQICRRPAEFFSSSSHADRLATYVEDPENRLVLLWAALLHDIGKPVVQGEKDGRIIFHGHDNAALDGIAAIGERLRWSRRRRQRLARLVRGHMWPFHLCNVSRRQPVSGKAILRLARRMEEDLAGVFLLAMADSLAGQGPEKPADCERRLVDLYDEVITGYDRHVRAVLQGPRLVTGRDLIERFGLAPGPQFSVILNAVAEAQAAGEIHDRASALAWLERFLSSEPPSSHATMKMT